MVPRRGCLIVGSMVLLLMVAWSNQPANYIAVSAPETSQRTDDDAEGRDEDLPTGGHPSSIEPNEGTEDDAPNDGSSSSVSSDAQPQLQQTTSLLMGDNTALSMQLEGTGRVIPFATGACHCLPQSSPTDGRWVSDSQWEPAPSSEEIHGAFVNVSAVFDAMRSRQQARRSAGDGTRQPKFRMLLIGDSITRYMMCFLAKSVALELAVEGLSGCQPEQSRGAHFQLWPPTPELRAQSPIVLQFVSDFYFPESHVAQDLSLMEEEESSWMPSAPDVIVVSRGTWDAWIRMPRASAGRHLHEGLTAGLVYMRLRYPHAEVMVYGLSDQYPARYHKHSERCAMQTSTLQVRSLVYCSARRANYEIAQLRLSQSSKADVPSSKEDTLLRPVRYVDFYPMTHQDKNWAANTMNSDGMHYVGPHEQWFARYVWRLVYIALTATVETASEEILARSTPLPLDPAECDESHLALNTMPRQKRIRNSPKAKGSKVKRDCGLWLADRQMLLDFHKSFHRLQWKNITPAIQYSDCVYYHKASAQRLGGVDLHWPSPHTESVVGRAMADKNSTYLFELTKRILPLRTSLWSRWRSNSEFCLKVERSLTATDLREMDLHIENGIVPCGHRLVFTLRAAPATRAVLGLPKLLHQHCDMVRGKRDL